MLDKTLAEEQADMRARWDDPSYRWANDSNLRRMFHANWSALATNTVYESGHNVAQPHSSGSEEAEAKGAEK